MSHVRLDQMSCRQRTAQRQLTGEHRGSHNTREEPRILAGRDRVSTTYAEHVEHGRLWL